MITNRMCECCGKQFIAARSDHRFCTANCRLINHRTKKSAPEVAQARVGLIDHYKSLLSQLSDKEVLGALGKLWTETPADRKARKESLLFTLLNKE